VSREGRAPIDTAPWLGGYWQTYVGQIPAQAFDKANEKFFRTTFFELCTRYLSRYFTFGIEVNHPSGRSDWEMQGRPESPHRHLKWIVEFKYHTKSGGLRLEDLAEAPPDAVAQLEGYKRDTLAKFPHLETRTAVCVIAGRDGFRWFDL
jgi:hypothetical protein